MSEENDGYRKAFEEIVQDGLKGEDSPELIPGPAMNGATEIPTEVKDAVESLVQAVHAARLRGEIGGTGDGDEDITAVNVDVSVLAPKPSEPEDIMPPTLEEAIESKRQGVRDLVALVTAVRSARDDHAVARDVIQMLIEWGPLRVFGVAMNAAAIIGWVIPEEHIQQLALIGESLDPENLGDL